MTEKLDLDALKALIAAATPGPWIATERSFLGSGVLTDGADLQRDGPLVACWAGGDIGSDKAAANAALIAAARTALPGLVEEVERLREFYAADCAVRAVGLLNATDAQLVRLHAARAALKGDRA